MDLLSTSLVGEWVCFEANTAQAEFKPSINLNFQCLSSLEHSNKNVILLEQLSIEYTFYGSNVIRFVQF